MPTKIKDHVKCKAWEKRRRDRLNDAFDNLAQLLPNYDPAKIPGKLDILEKSTEFVKELRLSNSRLLSSQAENDEKCRLIKELQDEVNKLILRVKQLTLLLKKAKITIPVGPEIKSLGTKRLKWSGKLKPSDVENTVIPVVVNSSANATKLTANALPASLNDSKALSPEKDKTSKSIPTAVEDGEKSDSVKTTESPPSDKPGDGDSASYSPKKAPPATSTPSIIIPLKEINTTKSPAPPYTITSTSTLAHSPPKTTAFSSSSSLTFTSTVTSISSPLKLITSAEPIFTTTSATPFQLPLQTFILTPCPITGSVTTLPAQTQLFPQITLQTPVLPKPPPLQKIAIKPVLKPIPVIKRRRNRKSKNPPQKNGNVPVKIQKDASTGMDSVETSSDVPEIIFEKPSSTSTTKEGAKDAEQNASISLDKNASQSQNVEENLSESAATAGKSSQFSDLVIINSADTKTKEQEIKDVIPANIPVLRIIESNIENDDAENDDILSKVVVAENPEAESAKEHEAEQPEIMLITIEDDEIRNVEEIVITLTQGTNSSMEVEGEESKESSIEHNTETAITEAVPQNNIPKDKDGDSNRLPSIIDNEVSKNDEANKYSETERMEVVETAGETSQEAGTSTNLPPTNDAPPTPINLNNENDRLQNSDSVNDIQDERFFTADKSMSVGEIAETSRGELNTVNSNVAAILPSNITETVPEEPETSIVISTVAPTGMTESQQIEEMEIPELSDPRMARIELMSLIKASEKSSKETLKPSSSEGSTLNTPHKQKPVFDQSNENVTTSDKISECIARSIDLIDANDSELMELGEHWDGAGASPRSPISPTQMFLNIFPLLPRESSSLEHQAQQPQTSQSLPSTLVPAPSQSTQGRNLAASTSRSSFFIDAMLPDDHSTTGGSGVLHESLEISSSSAQPPCLALTPPQYATPISSQQPSSPFSFTNNYFWTPSSTSTSNFECSLDFRPVSSSNQQISISSTVTSIFSSIPVTTVAAPLISASTVSTTKASVPSVSKSSVVSTSSFSSCLSSTPTKSTASSRSNKTKTVSSNSANASSATTSAIVSKPASSFSFDLSSALPSFSRSSSTRSTLNPIVTTVSATSTTTTNVTWTLTTPSQSVSSNTSSSHSHHHHHQITQPQSSNSQITQFPSSTSTCSLFDALAPMDASFFRPLMNALETNDFRGLEFPGSNVLPTPLPPLIPPPTKSLYPPKNISLNLAEPQPIQAPISIFDSTPQHQLPLAFPSTPEKSKKQKEDSSSSRNTKQNQAQSTASPSKATPSSSAKAEAKTKSARGSTKHKPETVKQTASSSSRTSKSSSRTQPYIIPSTSTSTDNPKPSSNSQPIHLQSSAPHPPHSGSQSIISAMTNEPPKNIFQPEFSHNYHCPNRKTSNTNTADYQTQNFFMPNLMPLDSTDLLTLTPAVPQLSQKQSTSKNTSKQTNTGEIKSSKSKEKSPSQSRSKGRATAGQSTSSSVQSQSQVAPSQSTSTSAPAVQLQQPAGAHSHSKSQTQNKSHNNNAAISHTVHQDYLPFHNPPEPFQLFPDFQQSSNHEQQELPASASYPAQITHQHHHHHPYYLPDIPTFETFTQTQPSSHGPQNPSSSFHSSVQHIQHTQHNFPQVAGPQIIGSSAPASTKNIHSLTTNNSNTSSVNAAPTYHRNDQRHQPQVQQQQPHFIPDTSQRHQCNLTHTQPNPNTGSFAYNQNQQQSHSIQQITNPSIVGHQNRPSQSQQRQEIVHHPHHTPQVPQPQHRQPQRSSVSSSTTSKSKHAPQHPPQPDHAPQTHHQPAPPPIPFQPHSTQQIHPQQHSHQLQMQTHHASSSTRLQQQQQPQPQPQQKPHPQPQPQQINRSSSSRTVNWMTDTAYRTSSNTSSSASRVPTSAATASVNPTTHKPQQQQQRPQNNPFSVSKLVGSTSGKSQPTNNPTATAGHSSGGPTADAASKAKAKSGNQGGLNPNAMTQQSQNQSNYCAEALIRKDTTTTDWNDFQFSNYPTHHHSHSQSSQQNPNSGDFTNYQPHYHYHQESGPSHSCNQFNQGVENVGSVQIQHFHHPPPQHLNPSSYHSSQQHQHNPQAQSQSQAPGQSHYQNAPNSFHQQSHHHHSYHSHHQPHPIHSSSTSSVSNFNLSSIFPEINDKRSNNNPSNTNAASNSSQNQGQSNTSQQAPGNSSRAAMPVSSRASGGNNNMCNFQQHPGFNNSGGNSGNTNLHH